eukprot:SAG22_NODE_18188_length_291_cov_1.072917_1_plen_22_part_10
MVFGAFLACFVAFAVATGAQTA